MSRAFLLKAASPLVRMPCFLRIDARWMVSDGARRSGPFRLAPYKKRHRERVGEAYSLKPEDKNQGPKYKRISKNMRDFPLRKHSRFTHEDDLANWAMGLDEDDDESLVADADFLENILEGPEMVTRKDPNEAVARVQSPSEGPELIPVATPKLDLGRSYRAPKFDAPEAERTPSPASPSSSGQGEEWPKPRVTLKDIPRGMRDMLIYKGMRQPVSLVIGKKGVDRGLLNCMTLHFRTHEVLKVRVSKMWKNCVGDMAAELEKKSGAVIIERAGSRILLFRGYTHADIPKKTAPAENYTKGWWQG